jgi:predicted DNA-binding transcriptional regulator AlpA
MALADASVVSRLVTERDASELLGVSMRTLQKWRLQGNGPRFVKLGHAVRYDVKDLEAYIEGGRRRSTSDATPLPTQ